MPELPEVQTVVNGLQKQALHRAIIRLEIPLHRMLKTVIPDILPFTLVSIERFGKYILLTTDRDWRIVLHLGMSGKITTDADPTQAKHLRLRADFADGGTLCFTDPRGFGRIAFYAPGAKIPEQTAMGIEPLSDAFDGKRLHALLHSHSTAIKTLLLHQQLIAGIGNIYACEALFRAKIHPATPGNELTSRQTARLAIAVREVLTEAIQHNGTTISDFRRIDEKSGEFQNFLRVYEKKTCACGTPIMRITQTGRTTWFCPKCQKERK